MTTVVVAGITRSGMSLTMQMLHAGGFPCQGPPPAFEPYALGKTPWAECDGTAVKLVDAHHHLPPAGDYAVVRLHRTAVEQCRSINKWNAAFGLPAIQVSLLLGSLRRDYVVIDDWVDRQRAVLHLRFEQLLFHPRQAAEKLATLVGRELDIDRMVECVVQRSALCYPKLLELELLQKYENLAADESPAAGRV